MFEPPFDPAVHESTTLVSAAVAPKPVGAEGAVALTVIVKDLVFPAYRIVFVGVNVAVIIEDPEPTKVTLAPPLAALTVVDAVFELAYVKVPGKLTFEEFFAVGSVRDFGKLQSTPNVQVTFDASAPNVTASFATTV
jgi:hypothetical protein